MTTSRLDVEGFILVGGQSRRMGADKSQLRFGKQTGVAHIAAALRPLAHRVRIVGSRDQVDTADLQNVPDLDEGWGALGGLHAALAACHSTWALIAACDLPFLTTELFVRLWRRANEAGRQDIDAIVPIQEDGRPQPLCAFYRPASCLRVVETLIDAGEHKPRALLTKIATHWVSFDQVSDLQGSKEFFLNVNTPADYEQAKSFLRDRGR